MNQSPRTLLFLVAVMTLAGFVGCAKKEVDLAKIRELRKQASIAYQAGEFASSGELYAQALKAGAKDPEIAYNAACSFALADDRANALKYLNKALMLGYREYEWMDKDSDLELLKQLPEWPGFIKRAHDNEKAYIGRVNKELYQLYKTDQLDRQRDWSNLPVDSNRAIYERDRARIKRVKQIVATDSLILADDYFHAALVMQHGKDSTEYKLAWKLASKAAELNPQLLNAAWLSAAAEDRYLQSVGKPQVWGTQWFKPSSDAEWTQEPYDTTAKSDEERVAHGVRTLSQQRARAKKLNQQ